MIGEDPVQHWAEDATAPINWRWVEHGPPGGSINNDSYFDTLESHDDWSHLVYDGGRLGGGVAPLPPETPADELDLATAQTLLIPAPVTKLNGHVANGNKLHLTWKPAGPKKLVTEYRIYRDGVRIGTTTNSNFDDSDVEPGIAYTYHVTWVNLLGQESVPSETVELSLN